ncbi:hypothetical protein [Xylanimonas sp. McL0601]|uniref:hypothetical protein n=1 Tax=Xylanimonas sp. McL0601 TaxID=3414739 RepID=UPI003CF2B663
MFARPQVSAAYPRLRLVRAMVLAAALSVVATPVLGAGPAGAATSSVALPATATLTAPMPTLPAVRVGAKIVPTVGAWTAGTALTYQWLLDGKAIVGATASTYTPLASSYGKTLSLKVTGRKTGYTPAARTSAGAHVNAGIFTAPTPKISGVARAGLVLTAVPGTWSPTASLTYQWKTNGAAIVGATKSTYTLTSSLRGRTVTVTVTGRASGYTTVSKTSAATATVLQYFKTAPISTLTIIGPNPGQPTVGSTLKAQPGTWSPTPTFTYQWKADGAAITGATAQTFTPTSALVGKRITVAVTGKATYYVTTTRTSGTTLPVVSTPTITTQLKSVHTAAPMAVSFTVKATGGDLAYSWVIRRPGSSTWEQQGTSPTLQLTAEAALNGAQVRVRVTNGAGSTYSSIATLTVDSTQTNPYPVNVSFVVGEARVTVSAVSTTPVWDGLTYKLGYLNARATATVCRADGTTGSAESLVFAEYVGVDGARYWPSADETDVPGTGCHISVFTVADVPQGGTWGFVDQVHNMGIINQYVQAS